MLSIIYGNVVGILVASILIFIFVKVNRKLRYFADRGTPYVHFSWVDLFRNLSFSKLQDIPQVIYKRESGSDKPYVGFYQMFTPAFLVLDPTMVENILIKDFSHFHDHGFDIDVKANPLFGHLFTMNGDEWRTLRHKLVPTFTSGKLRGMVPVMEDCANNLVKEIKQDPSLRQDTDLKDLFKIYTLDVIAKCAFGIDPASIKDPNCVFRQVMSEVLTPTAKSKIRFFTLVVFPKLCKIFKLQLFAPEITEFFLNFTRQSFELRRKSGVKSNDFIQLLLELKDKGKVDFDIKDLEQDEMETIEKLKSEQSATKLELTDELLMAQAFVFLVGGYDNTAFLTSIVFYVLSKHPEIQERVREEVKAVRSRHNALDYQALRDAKLLDACISEALRLYGPVPTLIRKCTKTYTLSDGMKIEKGMIVIVPSRSLHTDPKYWSNPKDFDPDRFLNGETIRSGVYLPFGDGPRICIAQRMAIIVAKMMVAKMVEHFQLLPSLKTKEPITINTTTVIEVEGGLWGSLISI